MTDYGIILAAGASRRMGQPKQLLELDGTTLVERAIEAVRQAGARPLVVLGARAPEIAERIRADYVVNADWQRGMGVSLARGVEALPDNARRALVLAVDQPDVDAELLRALLADCEAPSEASATRYSDRTLGVPACFRAPLFEALEGRSQDVGARDLLRSGAYRVAEVPARQRAFDIDTPEDWRNYLAHRAGGAS